MTCFGAEIQIQNIEHNDVVYYQSVGGLVVNKSESAPCLFTFMHPGISSENHTTPHENHFERAKLLAANAMNAYYQHLGNNSRTFRKLHNFSYLSTQKLCW